MCSACGFPAAPGHWTDAGAQTPGDRLRLRGEILRPDGSQVIAGERVGALAEGAAMGTDLAAALLGRAPADFFV